MLNILLCQLMSLDDFSKKWLYSQWCQAAKQLTFSSSIFLPRQGIKIQGEESESGSTSMREKMKQMAKTFGYGKWELGCQ